MKQSITIRKGTNVKTAFEKSMTMLWDYMLSYSKELKLQDTLIVEITRGRF